MRIHSVNSADRKFIGNIYTERICTHDKSLCHLITGGNDSGGRVGQGIEIIESIDAAFLGKCAENHVLF